MTTQRLAPAQLGGNDADLFARFYAQEMEQERVKRVRRRVIYAVGRALILGAFIFAWWFTAKFYPPLLVASPAEAWDGFMDGRSEIWKHAPTTVVEIALGFAVGSVLGIGLGALIAQSRLAEVVLRPYIIVSQAVPKIALAPILIIFLGFGVGPKVAIAALICFFPLLENTITGLRRVDPDSYKLFQSLGASKMQVFLKLRLYSALPLIFGGLRIAAVLATLGAIVAEFVAGNAGLGALLVISLGTFQTKLMYAVMVVLTLMAYTVYIITQWVEHKALERTNMLVTHE
ncbi:MAG: ABC transporter permease [Dehalococcoidia bacterium]|nr:ABC transporter permease [Dehalococcoidia bacterium]